MTSPHIPEPQPTNPDLYDDVHSRGSRYGQDLDAATVEAMLKGDSNNPFLWASETFNKFVEGVGLAIGGAIDLAIAIGGPVIEFIIGGVQSLINGFKNLIASVFTHNAPAEPLPEMLSPIKADLEAALKPFHDTVDSALEEAKTATESAKTANEEIDKINEELEAKIGEQGSLVLDLANAPTQEDYNKVNIALWGDQVEANGLIADFQKQQEDINAYHDQADEALGLAVRANQDAIEELTEYISRTHFVPANALVHNDHWTVSRSGGNTVLTAKGTWNGVAIVQYTDEVQTSNEGFHTHDITVMKMASYPVPGTNNTRKITLPTQGDILVNYTVSPGEPEHTHLDGPSGYTTLAHEKKTTLLTWTVPQDTRLTVSGGLTWSNKDYLSDYRQYLELGSNNILAATVAQAAPLFGHGPRTVKVASHTMTAKKGQVVKLSAWVNSRSNSINRRITGAYLDMTWIKESTPTT